ncbi:uncharacterized protein LOC107270969 [Cephus cinctus]|uniref:Uncharacterized protein LOC107270969 n=1 Tax=Cephus cinctus TaxID=211228 RepID=A0AAJ7RN10_CEPCN|nr:uncharacterized protein LOC107270969 [Cephus cinctus]
MTARYEPPDDGNVLTNEQIRRRYQDTSLVIFKEQQNKKEVVNYLSFGTSRRTMEYSNFGNQPVIVRRPVGSPGHGEIQDTSQVRRIYRKPQETCTIV